MDLREFQRRADETSQLRHGGPQAAVAPMLGLAGETGSILAVYKRYLRDGIDLAANRQFLFEELGDLLWYAAAVATSCGLDLAEVAEANLRRTRDLYVTSTDREQLAALPVLDASYPAHERFPRRLVIEFTERHEAGGRVFADLRLVSAYPNAFPNGPRVVDGRTIGFQVGARLGDPLTDNSRQADAYRFHDAIHFGFLAVLGWSPNLRSLLRLKRKSDPLADECEDGARAIFAEEGLAAVLSRLARRRVGFLTETAISGEVIDVARAAVVDLEVETMPGWLWRRAICHGFQALHQLASNGGGYLVADLDARSLSYAKYLAGHQVSDLPGDRTMSAEGISDRATARGVSRAVVNLHRAKNAAYREAWKRRGEVMSVLANLARKVDRLTTGVDTQDENILDTAVDLLVYAVKYQTFLADLDPQVAASLFDPEVPAPYSDGTAGFEALWARIAPHLFSQQAPPVAEAVVHVAETFADLEAHFGAVASGSTVAERSASAVALTSAAAALVASICHVSPTDVARFVALWKEHDLRAR